MASNIPPSSNIDVRKYQKSLTEWMRQYPQFSDYDYEGTNLSVLMGIFAFNAYNMAHYISMVGSEAWVDTAELRQSQVSHATDLNYLPRSRVSAQAVLNVEVFPDDQPQSIILPRYYRFKSTDNRGNTVYFVTDQDYVSIRTSDGRYLFNNVNIYQGEIVNEVFDVSGVQINPDTGIVTYDSPFVISSSNIDIKSLEVFVGSNAADANPVRYTRAKTLADTTNTSNTFFLRGIYDDQYAVEFGDGVFGAAIQNGNRVHIRYRDTLGPVVQGNYVITKTSAIAGYSNIIVTSTTRVQGGFERESVEELRRNSPRHFQTQDRAVTSVDYEILVKEAFPNIQQVHAYGGEEIQQYGKVIIVLKPFGTSGIVSDVIKNQIISYLKTKNIVPEPIIIDPTYYNVGISGNVYYEGDIATLTQSQIETNIIKNLVDLNDGDIVGTFSTVVYQSLINDTIKASDNSITGSDIVMDLRLKWNPQVNLNETLSFNTHNPFKKSLDGRYQTPDDYTLTSTVFTIFYNGELINAVIQDNGIGNIYYYRVNTDGSRVRIGQAIGTVNYDEGSVNLIANVRDYGNFIKFYIKLANASIDIIQDSFAIIDSTDIDIKLTRL